MPESPSRLFSFVHPDLWLIMDQGIGLPGMEGKVVASLSEILRNGMRATVTDISESEADSMSEEVLEHIAMLENKDREWWDFYRKNEHLLMAGVGVDVRLRR